MAITTYLSVTTLKANGLNASIKMPRGDLRVRTPPNLEKKGTIPQNIRTLNLLRAGLILFPIHLNKN